VGEKTLQNRSNIEEKEEPLCPANRGKGKELFQKAIVKDRCKEKKAASEIGDRSFSQKGRGGFGKILQKRKNF